MSRYATQPLNQSACSAADEELYARHANDPRPNALYDINGNRLPLDPNDPSQEALRSEWMDLYEAYGGDVAYDPPSSKPDDNLREEEDEVSTMPVEEAGAVETCPYENQAKVPKQYGVRVTTVTRIGEIPVQGVHVYVDGASYGPTDASGRSTITPWNNKPSFRLRTEYVNVPERLKLETFDVEFTNMDANSLTRTIGLGTVRIEQIRPSGSGDASFADTYHPSHKWTTVPNPFLYIFDVTVYLATISLSVPYRTQMDTSETITLENGQDYTKSADVICMPTCNMMLFDYWGINNITRAELMQHYYDHWRDEDLNPQRFWDLPQIGANYTPWQSWFYLQDTERRPMEELLPAGMRVWGEAANNFNTDPIPGAFATDFANSLAEGIPAMVSTRATNAGHIMVIRGAVASSDRRIHWLIMNDPYGNLDLPANKTNTANTNEEKGRHVYYNNQSDRYFAAGDFTYTPERGWIQIWPDEPLSIAEIAARLVPGNAFAGPIQ